MPTPLQKKQTPEETETKQHDTTQYYCRMFYTEFLGFRAFANFWGAKTPKMLRTTSMDSRGAPLFTPSSI